MAYQEQFQEYSKCLINEYDYGIEEYKKSLSKSDEVVRTGRIKVTLEKAMNLVKENVIFSSDAFAEIFIGNFRKDHKFSSVKGSSNPVWNESFEFELLDIKNSILVVQLWDHDRFTAADNIGIAAVNLGNVRLRVDEPVDVTVNLNNVSTGQVKLKITPLNFSHTDVDPNSSYVVDMTINMSAIRSFKSIFTRIITSEDDKHFDQTFGFSYVEDYMQTARTGDIFIHSGNTFASRAIEIATKSIWSHVGMILVDPTAEVRRLYELGDTDKIFVLDSDLTTFDKRFGGGVQIIEIKKFFYSYFHDWEKNNLTVIRKVIPSATDNRVAVSDFEGLEKWLIQLHKRPYQRRFLEMILSMKRGNSESTDASFFCSELLASNFSRMGYLPSTIVTSNFMPVDFSTDSNVLNTVLTGITLSKPIRVRSKQFDKETGKLPPDNANADDWFCCCSVM